MGKLVAGMLMVVLGMTLFAGSAHAAGIPPTKACVKAATKELEKYVNSGGVDGTKSQMSKANDRLVDNLAKADCISDADSLRNWVAPKPDSEQCVAAAAATNAFFKPVSVKVRQLTRRHRARVSDLKSRTRKVTAKLKGLRKSGAPRKQIRRVEMKQLRLLFKKINVNITHYIAVSEAVAPQAVANSVAVFELISLRCIGGKTYITVMRDNEFVDEPAAKVLSNHRNMINFSIQEVFTGFGSGNYASASTRAKNALEAIEEGDLAVDDQVPGGSGSYPLDSVNFRNLDSLP